MQDFLIPTFEQFQYLRALNKAKRQQQTSTAFTELDKKAITPDTARNDPDPSTTKNPRIVVTFPKTFRFESSRPVDPNEDDSATELDIPSPQPNDSKRIKHNDGIQEIISSNHPSDPVVSKANSTSPTTLSVPNLRNSSTLTPHSITKRNPSDKGQRPFGKVDYSLKLESSQLQTTPMAPKKAILPPDNSSPDQHDKYRRPHWYQRKRKRKLQQLKLSFYQI